jgi:hypothetical protein
VRSSVLVALLSLSLACSKSEPEAPRSVDAAAPTVDLKVLQRLVREAMEYRMGQETLARNADSYALDVKKLERMLSTVEAPRRMPVVSDPAADAALLTKALNEVGAALKLDKGWSVRVSPTPPAPAPSGRISSAVGVDYTDAHVTGRHAIEIGLRDALNKGPLVMALLSRLDRIIALRSVTLRADGGALIKGDCYYFRPLEPVTLFRPKVDLAARLAPLGVLPEALTGKPAARVAKIRAEYAAVDAVEGELNKALAHQAKLEVLGARWRFYKQHADRFGGQTWRSLLEGKGAGAAKDPHGH